MIDANLVTKEFKRYVWPLLQVHGFNKVEGRTMYRYRDTGIDVVNLQASVHNWLADQPFEFFIARGVFFPTMPRWYPVRMVRGRYVPAARDCDIGSQSVRLPDGKYRHLTWKLQRDGSNLDEVFKEVQGCIGDAVLPWFHRCFDIDEVLKAHLETPELLDALHLNDQKLGLLAYAFGKFDVAEHQLSGYVSRAAEAGWDHGFASEYLERAKANINTK